MAGREKVAGAACAKVLKLSGKTITRIYGPKLSAKTKSRRDARSAIVSTYYQGKTAPKGRALIDKKKATFVAFHIFPPLLQHLPLFSLTLGSRPVSPSGVATLRDKPVAGFIKLHY